MNATDAVSWQMVAMALIAALPGLIAAIVAAGAALSAKNKASDAVAVAVDNKATLAENTQAMDKVHEAVNSNYTAMREEAKDIRSKLEVALSQIGKLTGSPAQTIDEASKTNGGGHDSPGEHINGSHH